MANVSPTVFPLKNLWNHTKVDRDKMFPFNLVPEKGKQNRDEYKPSHENLCYITVIMLVSEKLIIIHICTIFRFGEESGEVITLRASA
jgi:hypothetical protein